MVHYPAFDLSGRHIHLWTAPLDGLDGVAGFLETQLTAAEQERARRYAFPHLRRASIFSRGTLRLLLSRYLGMEPSAVPILNSSNGKPFLGSPAGLQFNVSHSGNLALYAFTSGCQIGVDLEQTRPMPDLAAIAERFFCPQEIASLMSLPEPIRERGFFDCWTRKEAYLKATGAGLSLPLDSFCVSLEPCQPAEFLYFIPDHKPDIFWTLHDIQTTVPPGYAAALAYSDSPRRVDFQGFLDAAAIVGMG